MELFLVNQGYLLAPRVNVHSCIQSSPPRAQISPLGMNSDSVTESAIYRFVKSVCKSPSVKNMLFGQAWRLILQI
jgi:hypothetical protein